MKVSVLTPTIPERGEFLRECRHSVEAQTEHDYEHLIHLDEKHQGCAVSMNLLAKQAKGNWLLPLADDDLILPRCLQILLANADGADVVWSRPLVWGNDSPHLTQGQPPAIPSFALIRRELWEQLGGYDENRTREEDRGLWQHALDLGAVFKLVEEGPTWIYRFSRNPDGTMRNKSYHFGRAS